MDGLEHLQLVDNLELN